MSVFDKYDLVDIDESVAIPVKPSCGITVIVGSSGSGKSTILKAWGHVEAKNDTLSPIISLFDSEDAGEKFLIAAGLRSIPCWRRSLSSVSNGERHRAEIAMSMARGDFFIDEFTSVVDRDTARALCHSINRSGIENLVIATCHRDVLEWLDFDHAYDTDAKEWIDRGSLRRDRQIEIKITPCDTKTIWGFLKKHHYLSGKVNPAASSWAVSVGDKIVGMVSVIAFPNANWENGWRGHRTVITPEFQGMGIGSAASDAVADYIVSTGARYFSKTSHPALGEHRNKSPKWKPTSKNRKPRKDYSSSRKTKEDGHKMKHSHRVCYSHEYVGDGE